MKILNITKYESFDELYEQYLKQNKELNDLRSLIILFVASDDPKTQKSWCCDCRDSKPIFDETIKNFEYNDHIVLAIVQVGQRDEWKNSDNPFRKHPLQISAVPTLLSLKNVSTFPLCCMTC